MPGSEPQQEALLCLKVAWLARGSPRLACGLYCGKELRWQGTWQGTAVGLYSFPSAWQQASSAPQQPAVTPTRVALTILSLVPGSPAAWRVPNSLGAPRQNLTASVQQGLSRKQQPQVQTSHVQDPKGMQVGLRHMARWGEGGRGGERSEVI